MMLLSYGARLLIGFVLYAGYLCGGAFVFQRLELPHVASYTHYFEQAKREFLKNNLCVLEDDLEELIAEVVIASSRGVPVTINATAEPNWSFGQSLFFSGTVVTTIGYGHVTPLSRAGKAFCILYAVFGIPFTLVLISALVERLLVPVVWFLELLNKRLGHLYQPFKIRVLHLLIIVLLVVVIFILIPAAIFTSLEHDWDYLDSLYYCFISLTTIGLGDYIPGDTPGQPMKSLYKIITTVYLIVGITFIMTSLAVFYDIPQLNLGQFFSGHEGDVERMHLIGKGSATNRYTEGVEKNDPNVGDAQSAGRHVVKVKSRLSDDSFSPNQDY